MSAFLKSIERANAHKGTHEYKSYKKERFRGFDTVIKNCDGFTLNDQSDRKIFKDNYQKSSALYYKGKISFEDIFGRISNFIEIL